MSAPKVSKYDTEIDLSNKNTSHALLVDLIGGHKRVLDVGCSTGYLARVLTERGCTVSGFEYDAEAAEQARPVLETLVVGDLEKTDLQEAFAGQTFDVVVFGDVLEHLMDPLAALANAKRVLVPGGSIVASIPNIAHASVRLALLQGRFAYNPLGLLDNTHIRFFTRETINTMFHEAGMVVTRIEGTTTGPFQTEIKVDEADLPEGLVDRVLEDRDAHIYQFVVEAMVSDREGLLASQRTREMHYEERIAALESEVGSLRRAAEVAAAREEQLTEELQQATDLVAGRDAQIEEIMNTRTMRIARMPRAIYGSLRRP